MHILSKKAQCISCLRKCICLYDIDQKIFVFRQLGFMVGVYYTGSHYGSVEERFAMMNVNCRGTESYLQDCSYSADGGCGRDDGAGVYCYDLSTYPPSSSVRP